MEKVMQNLDLLCIIFGLLRFSEIENGQICLLRRVSNAFCQVSSSVFTLIIAIPRMETIQKALDEVASFERQRENSCFPIRGFEYTLNLSRTGVTDLLALAIVPNCGAGVGRNTIQLSLR